MAEISLKFAGFYSRANVMRSLAVDEARSLLADLIGPMAPGDRLKNRWPALTEITGLSVRRLRGIWNREARRIDADEMRALDHARKKIVCAPTTALLGHAAYFEARAASLEAQDADFYRGEIHRLRSMAGRIRHQIAGVRP